MANRSLAFLLLFAGLVLLILGASPPQQRAAGQSANPPAGGNPHGPIRIECDRCHTAGGWRPLRKPILFDHTRETNFPLVKGHRSVECSGCHRDLRFSHVASSCADCHADPHRGRMAADCETCHSPAGWDDRRSIVAIHSAASFPLTGAHVVAACASCHADAPERFAPTPTRCFDCHEDDYRRAQPDHVRSGFPTTCQSCHSTASFEGGFFPQHDQVFPIFSGAHRGVWSSCTDCHNSNNFQTFTCLSCHAHERQEMDDEHDDVRNYRYDSPSCLSCHPRGHE